MTIQLFANNAKTTLAAPVSSTQTTIVVAPGTGALFPSPTSGQAFKITLVSASSSAIFEICLCTARSGDTLTVVRGQEGTSAQPFVLNDVAGNFDTKEVMEGLIQVDQLQSQKYQYATATGSANALAATVPSNFTAIPNGMYLTVIAATANTGAATLNLTLGSTVVGASPIVKGSNAALIAGDIPGAGYPLQLNWSNTYSAWVLQNPATGIFVSSVPVGAIVQFPCASAPSGYLLCNGQLVSRATYPSLWSFAQSSGNISATDGAWTAGKFSPGNGSTTFRLPQFGGYFLRPLDNGNGIDPARAIGTVQSAQNQSHTHGVTDPGHHHNIQWGQVNSGVSPGMAGNDLTSEPYNIVTSAITTTEATGISVNSSGGTESRPINISVLTCIKY